MSTDVKQRFISRNLASALDNGVVTPEGLFGRVTPKHLAEHLPPAVMASLLQRSLEVGSLTPSLLIDTLGVDGLAAHVPFGLLWDVITDAMENPTLADGADGRLHVRVFMGGVLESQLELRMITAEEALRHMTPALMMELLPVAVRTALLESCLGAEPLTPQGLIDFVGAPVLARHLPVEVIWAAICSCDFDDLDLDLQVMDMQSTVEPAARVQSQPGRGRRKISPAATRRRRAGDVSRVPGK